jgi:hypothetical protein
MSEPTSHTAHARPSSTGRWSAIQSADYKVSGRWVFYRLLQDGLYQTKQDYGKFILMTSRARKSNYGEWRPDTLADETRAMLLFVNDGGQPDPDIDGLIQQELADGLETLEYYKSQIADYRHYFEYKIDPNYYQDRFCIVLFEARAMIEQFKRYTAGLTLCPFGGQPSIPYKWAIAKYIESKCEQYDKSAVIFYFGDHDKGGRDIYKAAMTDIKEWCAYEIEEVYCGCSEQAIKYRPENPERPASTVGGLTDELLRKLSMRGLPATSIAAPSGGLPWRGS